MTKTAWGSEHGLVGRESSDKKIEGRASFRWRKRPRTTEDEIEGSRTLARRGRERMRQRMR